MSRLGTPYNEILAQRAQDAAVSGTQQGVSGYFSTPTLDLDPRLFPRRSDSLIPSVRAWILSTLYRYWLRKYAHPQWWSTVWIAGSGITYQWSGGRSVAGPGDLDVLIGIDWPLFFRANASWIGTPDAAMATQMNEEFHNELWPSTSTAVLPSGGEPFEVTFYVNPTGTDIRDINPYAAYNVTTDDWTVKPPILSEQPNEDVPGEWKSAVEGEAHVAQSLTNEYTGLRNAVLTEAPSAPRQINLLTRMHQVLSDASNLYGSIHTDRRMAFSEGGQGYSDYYNYRWQRHKLLGSGAQLHALAGLDHEVHKDVAVRCYNGGILDAQHALMLATRAVGR